jgi:hypothetical protein
MLQISKPLEVMPETTPTKLKPSEALRRGIAETTFIRRAALHRMEDGSLYACALGAIGVGAGVVDSTIGALGVVQLVAGLFPMLETTYIDGTRINLWTMIMSWNDSADWAMAQGYQDPRNAIAEILEDMGL